MHAAIGCSEIEDTDGRFTHTAHKHRCFRDTLISILVIPERNQNKIGRFNRRGRFAVAATRCVNLNQITAGFFRSLEFIGQIMLGRKAG